MYSRWRYLLSLPYPAKVISTADDTLINRAESEAESEAEITRRNIMERIAKQKAKQKAKQEAKQEAERTVKQQADQLNKTVFVVAYDTPGQFRLARQSTVYNSGKELAQAYNVRPYHYHGVAVGIGEVQCTNIQRRYTERCTGCDCDLFDANAYENNSGDTFCPGCYYNLYTYNNAGELVLRT